MNALVKLLAVLSLLIATGYAQECKSEPPNWKDAALAVFDAYVQLDTAHRACVSALTEAEAAVEKSRLPLYVNPGECYRIGGDMSMHQIACPESTKQDIQFKFWRPAPRNSN